MMLSIVIFSTMVGDMLPVTDSTPLIGLHQHAATSYIYILNILYNTHRFFKVNILKPYLFITLIIFSLSGYVIISSLEERDNTAETLSVMF